MPDNFAGIEVAVDGAPLDASLIARLADVRVDLVLGVPDCATLRFQDDWQMSVGNATTFSLGRKLVVKLTDESGGLHPVFDGEITEIDAEFGDDGAQLVVTGLELAHRLTHGTRTHTYLKANNQDVVSLIAGDHRLQSKVDVVGSTQEYLLQSCTDYAFLTERARASGARWFVEDDTVHFVEAVSEPGRRMTWGENLRRFRARASLAEGASEIEVKGWDPKTQKAVVGSSAIQDSGLLVRSTLAEDARKAGVAIGGRRFRGEATAVSATEAEAIAGGLSRRVAAEMASARGECMGDPELRPGTVLDVVGVGTRVSGSYVCTSVTHVLAGRQRYVSRFSCGGSDPGRLVDLLGGGGAQRSDPTAAWADRGLVVGVVTDTKDAEKLGRVKVMYPTLSDSDDSAWARVVSIGAGGGRGVQSIPEEQDEVLVGFEHGDPRRPVVLGGLWSSRYKPPGEPDTDTEKFFTMKSLRGSELVLQDTRGKENLFKVDLHGGGGTFQLGEQASTLLDSRSEIKVTGDRDITIKATGKVVIDAQEIVLKAGTKVSIEGMNVEIKGKVGFKAEATQFELKGSATGKIDGGGMTEVKGGILKLN